MNSLHDPVSLHRCRAARAGRAVERCREVGLRLTPQRLAVLRALSLAVDHPSPEALYSRVRPSLPSLSLATVYKTLEMLMRFGLAQEVPATGNAKRYDADTERHHHLVCTRCNAVQDYYNREFDRIEPPRRLPGFTAHGVSIQIHGLCEACARAAEPRHTPHARRRRNRTWPRN